MNIFKNTGPEAVRQAPAESPGGRRWIVVSLLFAAMLVNYVNRGQPQYPWRCP